jgi:hypothetical protein
MSDKMYIILRGPWCDIVLNVQLPTEDKIYDTKDRFTGTRRAYSVSSRSARAMLAGE